MDVREKIQQLVRFRVFFINRIRLIKIGVIVVYFLEIICIDNLFIENGIFIENCYILKLYMNFLLIFVGSGFSIFFQFKFLLIRILVFYY